MTNLSNAGRGSGDDDDLSGDVFGEDGAAEVAEGFESEVGRKEEEECGGGEDVESSGDQIHGESE